MADDDSISGRVRRYARVSTAMGGLAARLAGERYLGIEIDRPKHAADLTRALGGIKGPLMKVAQLLATIPNALPQEYARELASLQSDAPAMGWPFVKRRMASELGENWEQRFKSFEHEAARAASLGQVHRAVAKDSTALACKLQYPDMGSAVEADLQQLKFFLSLYERYDRAVTTDEIHAEIGERLREELDYEREAAHMRLYRLMLAKEKEVTVPEPVPELSTSRLLTMTWIEGSAMLEAVKKPQAERNAIAQAMFRAWYVPFYYYGVIHGDPHLGNYTVRSDNGINLLDFGCIRIFPSKFVKGVIDLYHALDRDDRDLAVAAYKSWGFGNLNKEMIEVLNRWARFLYAPLLENRKRRIQEQEEEGIYGRELAEDVHRQIRRLGGVKPPREFVFMDRAALGLGSVFTHLKAEINWHRLFHELIEDFDSEGLEARQKKALTAAGVPQARPAKPRRKRG
ncbi:MAG TPA: AarF/ABC1/UbiB kinase family protein [Stellaceae bacterium]|jgi:predicted unusual protein kinase regulating ubiquinone biosynthesis (AarF/ABC1/UbiB family)|nr:AarF/ABC1/UbiB kinase family protein [Stellaceae bacterium]